ncbi:anhydro-N-acetylmuramic acid kinase [Neisseria animalis]|uniref:Anhydro-N-acetylmuramic acid kinase n=1 Tax=Neisseria animalis TaxID=492 RepID=A0A5P3MR73_NEIAN|nr:anhydro-N-acetylmuramic acid kinase [Neisseria animalis]QEY24093.1 anhydro-N-acetylmuramic acid kinase [Neisseria animalis]ROW32661.1 anhydro-N-acetylmuramic acid kinase [Neisseria animalis]VEE06264.1 anhydro-N-acetylmuramic acid kinase [Neisseria animalis]
MASQYYIGLMSGTSMDGADAVLIQMDGGRWLGAAGHAFVPFADGLRQDLLALQDTGYNELHRSIMLSQTLSRLYADVVQTLLAQHNLQPSDITAIGCHGQTVRHAPEYAYSVQLADLPLLAELTGIFTVGDFRSRDLAAGGQGAPLVPAFHQALFRQSGETRVVLNIGGIANISVLPPQDAAFGFDTGPGNMLMDAWMQHIWQLPYDQNGEKASQGRLLPDLLAALLDHPYFSQPYPKSTGRELFSLEWLRGRLQGGEAPEDVLQTLLHYTARTIFDAVIAAAPDVRNIYVCGGGIRNGALMDTLSQHFAPHGVRLHSTAALNLDPQQVEAAAFGWLAACWVNRIPGNPHHATGANKPCILGAGHYA